MHKKILSTFALFFSLTTGVLATNHVPPGPGVNIQSCSNSSTTDIADGAFACYGIWDYGSAFGGDSDNCRDGNGGLSTGCSISTPICSSHTATATSYFRPRSLNLDSPELVTLAANLQVSAEVAQEHIAGLWIYTCGAQNIDPLPPTPVAPSPEYFGSSTPKGTYSGYLSGNLLPISTKEFVSRAEAFRTCDFDRGNYPESAFSCLWKEEVIYSSVPPVKISADTGISITFINKKTSASLVQKNLTQQQAQERCQADQKTFPDTMISCVWKGKEIYTYSPEIISPTICGPDAYLTHIETCISGNILVYYKIYSSKLSSVLESFSPQKLEDILKKIDSLQQNSHKDTLGALKVIILEELHKKK